MRKIKICTVVTGSTMKEFLFNLKKIQEISDMVELRVDFITSLKENDIKIVKQQTQVENILTCHNNDRLQQKVYNMGFDYLDIDLTSIRNFTFNDANKTKIIISYHNFDQTPSLKKLESIKKKKKKYKPDIMKFATMVNSDDDIRILFQLLLNKKQNEQMIIIGMGNKGKTTRILGPLLGNYLTYASTPYSRSAPGQLNIDKLKAFYFKYI
jgi:3-dehydroquinate dehydratase-1